MNIIVRLKRLFRKNAGEYKLPDTSAWSTHLEKIKRLVEQGVKVIVTEGTRQELRDGYRKYEVCRQAYDYISSNPNLLFPITKDKMKSWPVDDQNVAIAYEFYNKGINITFVTCDREQAHKAKIRGLNIELLPGNRPQNQRANEPRKVIKPASNPVVAEPVVEVKSEQELTVPCITKGKEHYINIKHDVAVYTNKGKRRIGRENLIPVQPADVLSYMNCNYIIEDMTDTYIALKKM